jgi:hypothetical protein
MGSGLFFYIHVKGECALCDFRTIDNLKRGYEDNNSARVDGDDRQKEGMWR